MCYFLLNISAVQAVGDRKHTSTVAAAPWLGCCGAASKRRTVCLLWVHWIGHLQQQQSESEMENIYRCVMLCEAS